MRFPVERMEEASTMARSGLEVSNRCRAAAPLGRFPLDSPSLPALCERGMVDVLAFN